MNFRGVATGGVLAVVGLLGGAALADGYAPPIEAPTEGLCFDKGLNDFVPCEVEEAFVGPWTGFYAGLHDGVGRTQWGGSFEATIDGVDNTLVELDQWDETGYVVGGQIGYNHHMSNGFVLGLEGDFSRGFGFGSEIETLSDTIVGPDDTVSIRQTTSVDVSWLASLRLKAGAAFGDFMPYATAGVGFGRYSSRSENFLNGAPDGEFEFKDWAIGPVVGGGAGYMLTPNMLVRGEGLYFIFNDDVSAIEFDGVIVGRVAFSVKF